MAITVVILALAVLVIQSEAGRGRGAAGRPPVRGPSGIPSQCREYSC